MHSYLIEFNLEQRGEQAEEFLADAVRTWPALWGDIPGVTGTLLLSSALALGGDFAYQWRVDIESPATLSRVDAALKSDDRGWRKSRKEWFKARTSARAHISLYVAGNEKHSHSGGDKSGAIHFVFNSPDTSADRLGAVGSASGVVSAQTLRPIIGSPVAREQTWVRLESLDHLDSVAGVDLGAGYGQVFGEIRELDGSLFVGA
jgi:hypothetical protein